MNGVYATRITSCLCFGRWGLVPSHTLCRSFCPNATRLRKKRQTEESEHRYEEGYLLILSRFLVGKKGRNPGLSHLWCARDGCRR